MIRYARAPSPAFEAMLAPGGLLSPLLKRRVVAGLPLDIHLRERDRLQLYCGLTRLLDAARVGRTLRISADPTYATQACAVDLFRTWRQDETGFDAAVECYLTAVTVREKHVLREGAVQAGWAGVTTPWTPFDREAVLGYRGIDQRNEGRLFPAVAAARAEIERLQAANDWAAPPSGKVGAELDQLAVDPNGRLVLIELKDAGAAPSSVYYAPLQLLQYVHECRHRFS